MAAAEVKIVFAGGFPDEADLGNVGARAAIGASGHADGDGVVAQAGFLEHFLDPGNEIGEVALRLGEGESAGRESDAGHGVQSHRGALVGVDHAVFLKQLGDLRFLLRGDVGDDEILIRGETEVASVDLRDGTQAGEEGILLRVVNAAVLDVEGEMPVATMILDPAVAVAVVFKMKFARAAEFELAELLDFLPEGVDPHRLDRVFETGVGAHVPVAVVALDADDGLAHLHGLVGRAEA